MKLSFKKHLGYGLLPATFIILLEYSYYFSFKISEQYSGLHPIIVSSIIYLLFLLFVKSSITPESILNYLGFKFLELKWIGLIFSLYYVGMLLVIKLFNEEFAIFINPIYIISLPAMFFMCFYYIYKNFKFAVTFFKLTPNIYIDLIEYKLHTKKEIRDYDVIPMYEEDLNLEDIKNFYDFFYSLQFKKLKPIKQNNNIDRIEIKSIDSANNKVFLHAYDKSNEVIWETSFEIKNLEHPLEDYLEYIKFFENYSRR